jgi:hypothetical protein
MPRDVVADSSGKPALYIGSDPALHIAHITSNAIATSTIFPASFRPFTVCVQQCEFDVPFLSLICRWIGRH